MSDKNIWNNIISYRRKSTLYPFLLMCFLLIVFVSYFVIKAYSSIFAILICIIGLFAYVIICVLIYKSIIKIDVRLSAVAKETASNTTVYDELDSLLDSFEVLYENRYHQQLLQNQAQIKALQSQINPHFLYNTLDSIRGQALEENSREIADMLGALSAFFRYTISSNQDEVSIEQELHNVENYMKIQQYRFSNRFSLKIAALEATDRVLRYRIPKLTLQPIVENAINHGLKNLQSGGIVTISIKTDSDILTISVNDNGCGISEKDLIELNKSFENPSDFSNGRKEAYSGIALKNVNERISLMYGERYGLHVYSAFGIGTTVDILLPYGDAQNEV